MHNHKYTDANFVIAHLAQIRSLKSTLLVSCDLKNKDTRLHVHTIISKELLT